MKNLVKSILVVMMSLLFVPVVKAEEGTTATLEFVTGSSEVNVGDIIDVQMNVKDIMNTEDGIVSLGGYLTFDNTKLEYLGSTLGNAPYLFQINEEHFIIAGLDFTLENGIKDFTNIYTFSFRVIDEGNTEITLYDARLTDCDDYIKTTVIPAKINIGKRVESEESTLNVSVNKVNAKTETLNLVSETEMFLESDELQENKIIIDEIKSTIGESFLKLFMTVEDLTR